MQLSNERTVKVYKFDLDLTEEEESLLVRIGLEKIQTDRKSLIEFAVIRLLEDHIKNLSDQEEKQNGTGNKHSRKKLHNTKQQG